MIRLFVGLPLPEPLRAALAEHQNGVPGARWVEPADLHVTLRFIDEVDEGLAADVDEALAAVRVPAPRIALHGLGAFGDRRGTRALWVGVEPDAALSHLHDRVEAACRIAGLEPETRKFKPHITLARFSSRAAPPGARVEDIVAANTDWRPPPGLDAFTPDRFTLFSSHLGCAGAHYTAEREYALG